MMFNRNRFFSVIVKGSVFAAILAVLVSLSACSSGSSPSPSPAVSPSPSPSAPTADALLSEARTAAQAMKKYAFELQLNQKLSGDGEDSNSNVQVNMQGRAELGPLKLDQTVKSDIDGETYSMRAILVPDAYYMYDPDNKEWSKLPNDQLQEVMKTLSNLQVDPAKSLEGVRSLGSALKADRNGEAVNIRYEGNGPEAKAFLDSLLESTLDLSGMDKKVRDSIRLETLRVSFTLDAAHLWPMSFRIESIMTVEFEPGKPSTLEQTLTGSYSQHNASAPVTLPDEARNAPERDAPMDEAGAD